MTGTFSRPRLTMVCSAGKIFLYARSPVAPKKTRASDAVQHPVVTPRDLRSRRSRRLCRRAELRPRSSAVFPSGRRIGNRMAESSLSGKVGFAARGEPLVQGRGQHGGRHGLVDGGLDRPAPFARVGNAARKFGQRRILRAASRRVRSSSQEAMTLPRRQTSAMSASVADRIGNARDCASGVVSASMLLLLACRRWRAAGSPGLRRRRP